MSFLAHVVPDTRIKEPRARFRSRFGRDWNAVRLAIAAVLASSLASLATAGALSPGAPLFTRAGESTSIPAEITGHAMYVNVMINGRGPYRVLVDTGCSLTLVSPEVARAVEAEPPVDEETTIVAQNGLGESTGVDRVVLGNIELGGVRFEGVQAAVSDSFGQLSAIDGKRVDGALGFPLFRDLFLGFDFPNRRLLLGTQWPANVPTVRASLPVTEYADVPYVPVQIQGKRIDLMIDTGSNQSLQLPAEAVPQLQWKVEPRAGSLIAVIGGIGRSSIGRLAGALSFEGAGQIDPVTVISTGAPSLGLRALENFCVIFHQRENRVWFCVDDSAPVRPVSERSVGFSLMMEAGGWRVAGTIPGSQPRRPRSRWAP